MKLRIFSSSRQIKEYFNQNKSNNTLLDSAINISEFLDKVCLSNLAKASSYESLLLMQEACLKSKDLENKLGISAEFFVFLKNSEYLFSFFKELSLEKKSIQDLKNNDYYAAYNEHLEILDEVYNNYLALLEKNSLYDALSLVQKYSLNIDFLDQYESIIYNLEGFLSKFEEDLLSEISQFKEVILSFKTSKFNLDYLLKLDFLKKLNLKVDTYYEINLSKQEILKEQSFKTRNSQIKLKSFELRSLQCAFVMDEISHFVRKGLKPENIVVITPDESFCELLRLFDTNRMLNFAYGISIKQTLFYQKLQALYESANSPSFIYKNQENYFEDMQMNFDYYNVLLHALKLDFIEFKHKFNEKCDLEYFQKLLALFLKDEKQELIYLVQKELYFIKDLLKNQTLKLKELMQLFFMQISQLTLSDVGGGKVTVMGLLESRGLCFDGVVLVDFNEEFIPKRSVNELFLNNQVRKKAGLISYDKRENLQRFYYESLIKNALEVSICFVQNEEKSKSRFLDELDFDFFEQTHISQKAYLNALKLDYEGIKPDLTPLKAPILKHNPFESALSFSRFNLLNKQKRTYYYRYILNLLEPRVLSKENKAKNQGNFIHKVLEIYYKDYKNNDFDIEIFIKLLDQEYQKYNISELDLEVFKLKFLHFAKNEKEHFSQGYRVISTELELSKTLKLGDDVIKLKGTIDRIDNSKQGNLIIDYKTGTISSDSYQLAFYQALYDEHANARFYDLKNMQIFNQKTKSLEELKERLKDLINQSQQAMEFENEQDQYCPYKLIYKKELK
ncbi:PD-(D/E)XK nuclease family protein [Campylobacter sp. VicNov18]|uniref:PD-(D/E)XK nuclease family protein n=1 Tax=Campylobacter bilis TaxID=2691918 RepID=UPI00130E8B3E|nr:PD-(D/E)XK nuclease family protein [Campylobacter bilis]MPV63960.1 hypothetical protein [Campylobacter hepaticus]MBM0637461.1 hypothetical protein [Campylobacter bilis]MCC8278180.1 PD-(D/E)XK nuclease family protein [Campylobacter bilis]MCC8299684.1 PD-(D/E)XK nuclease family protein [Campylobacter bilis]MCC8301089.1 PD-(D/E)XK nuclease family protein [Campylobacter bilis]